MDSAPWSNFMNILYHTAQETLLRWVVIEESIVIYLINESLLFMERKISLVSQIIALDDTLSLLNPIHRLRVYFVIYTAFLSVNLYFVLEFFNNFNAFLPYQCLVQGLIIRSPFISSS